MGRNVVFDVLDVFEDLFSTSGLPDTCRLQRLSDVCVAVQSSAFLLTCHSRILVRTAIVKRLEPLKIHAR